MCPQVREMMHRLQTCMKKNFVINSGYTPEELETELNHRFSTDVLKNCHIVENDMSKYDKSQDGVALAFEMKLFKLLGMSQDFCDTWYEAHAETIMYDRFNGVGAKVRFQRKSGDAATFIGDTAFLMAVTAACFDLSRCECGLFAGDKHAALLKKYSSLKSEGIFNSNRQALQRIAAKTGETIDDPVVKREELSSSPKKAKKEKKEKV